MNARTRTWGLAIVATWFGAVGAARAEDAPTPAPPAGGGAPDAAPEEPKEERGLAIGDVAPPLDVAGWLNVPEGKAPTPESLKGKRIYLEFWATTCGPCVRTMPKVQEFHERYGPRGLVVLALSPDPAFKQTEFAKERGLTFPLGVDSGDAVRQAYRVDGIPMTYLIGSDGKIAARTSPAHADEAVERFLGCSTGPTGPLDDYLTSMAGKDAAGARFHVERLASRGARAVDLAAWAKGAGGAAPPDAKPAASFDGAKALAELVKARAAGDAARTKASLDALATSGPKAFDLSAWARDVYARDYPITPAEVKALAEAKRFDALVDAMLDRRPPASALDAVLKQPAFQEHAAKGAKRERNLARRALMILLYPLANKPPKSEEANERFWKELSSSSWVEGPDRRPVGMDVEGTMIFLENGPAQVERWLSRAFVMDAVTAGKKPDLAKVKGDVAKARAAVEKDLRATYGG